MIVAVESTRTEEIAQVQSLRIVRRPQSVVAIQRQGRPNRLLLGIGAAIVAGVTFGIGAFATVGHQQQTLRLEATADRIETTQTVVPVTFQPTAIDSAVAQVEQPLKIAKDQRHESALEEIRIRNRRLEALVKVLRRRDAGEHRLTSANNN